MTAPNTEHDLSLLRFVTCGSVDDGKSTLIGRLLHDSKSIFEDQLASITQASAKLGTTGGALDLAFVTDGLKAEREQGITIDVAYRYFSTPKRKFIIADCPGHEQYTRNMATGASTADLAILLVDASKGVVTQTRRHAYIVSLLGLKHVVLAVNKMDLVNWSKDRFDEIVAAFEALRKELNLKNVIAIPFSALMGDNVTNPSPHSAWYKGPTLLEHLETVDASDDSASAPLRLPVQFVSRPDLTFRGYMGTLAAGTARPGDKVTILPSGVKNTIAKVFKAGEQTASVQSGDAVTITLEKETDASRGDLIVHDASAPRVSSRFKATLVWLSTDAMIPGRQYRILHTSRLTTAVVSAIDHRVDVNTLQKHAATQLGVNEIASVTVETTVPLAFDAYTHCRGTGAFILIDRTTYNTVGAGMITGSDDSTSTDGPVRPAERAIRLQQKPVAVVLRSRSIERSRDVAVALDRAIFSAGYLASVVDPGNHAAVGQLLRAGLIAIVVNDPSIEGTVFNLDAEGDSLAPTDLAARLRHKLASGGVFDPTESVDDGYAI
jgi:bifunctional enzyme CysN/CysC